MTHLVIGLGEIGKAVQNIFDCHGRDIDDENIEDYDIVHICFPYSDNFVSQVRMYDAIHGPSYLIIHSTVPPGTSRELNAIHSPVIGIHPYLEESIRTFTKFLGGEAASLVADEFRKRGIKVFLFDKQETTELMKILDTTFYGVCAEYTKDVKRQAQAHDVPFEAWKIWTDNYNQGYQKLGYPEYTRPNLVPIMKTLGGHCVLNNASLIETKFTKLLKDSND